MSSWLSDNFTDEVTTFYPSLECTSDNNLTCQDDLTTLPSLYDQPILLEIRVAVLWICAIFGILGNALVLSWIVTQHSRRSRITVLILHLTLSDLLVLGCATLPQIVWEYVDRVWRAGDFGCRLFKFLQTFSITVSNYMVVVLAIDRYCAIRRPLKKPPQVCRIAGAAWGVGALINAANLFLYEVVEIKGRPRCRSILYDLPNKIYFKVYMTVIVLVIFFVPLLIIVTSYVKIFQKIAQKASEGKASKKSSIKPGKVHLQATPSSSLPRAKIKTLKMTVVIVVSFVVCSGPYFICELWRFYGNQTLSAEAYSILAALAVSNSASNPFVLLVFNSSWRWWNVLCRKFSSSSPKSRNHDSVRTTTVIHSEEHEVVCLNMANGRKVKSNSSETVTFATPLTSV